MKFNLTRYRKSFNNISVVMIANLLKLTFGLILIPVYVRYVPPQELGKFDLIISFIPILNQLISMGLTNSLSKFYLQTNNNSYLTYVRATILIHTKRATALLTITYIAFYDYSSTFVDFYIFILFVILLVLENTTFVQARIYNFNENYKRNAIVEVSKELIRYTGLISLVIIMDDKLMALFIGTILSWGYHYIQTYFDNKAVLLEPASLSTEQLIELKKYSMPLILLGLSGFLYLSIDRIVVSIFSSSIEQVGFLGMAQRISTVLTLLIGSIATVLGITMFKTVDMRKLLRIQNGYLLTLLILIVIAISFYFIFQIEIVKYLLTANYSESYLIGVLLLTSLYWNKCRENIEYFFLITNKTKLVTKVFVFFAFINISMSIYFVIIFDALGAVLATNITFVLHALTLFYLASKHGHRLSLKSLMIALVLNILLFCYLFY